MSKNYYHLLEIGENSTKTQIRDAYKKMALKYHPDRNNNKTTKDFQQISEAYQVLYNEKTRLEYDNNNKEININFKNPVTLFKSLFPNYVSNKVLVNILNKIEDSDISYEKILKNIEKIYKKNNVIKKNIYIDVKYKLFDHYNHIFYKNVFIDTKIDKCNKKFKYQIDIRDSKNLFIEEVIFNDSLYKILVNINTIPECHYGFRIIDKYNLIYNIDISIDEYYSGLIYNLDLYGDNMYIEFKCIDKSFMLFIIKNLGLPYDDKTSGDLYFRLKISKNIEKRPNKFGNLILAKPVNFF